VAAPIRRLSGVSHRPSGGRHHRRGWLRSPLDRPRGCYVATVAMYWYTTEWHIFFGRLSKRRLHTEALTSRDASDL